eukprot:scaffold6685_cov202-Prasinococcus_capsulatus_cf.AAC.7
METIPMPADGLAGQSLAQGPHEQRNDGRFLISASLFMSAVVGCGTCIRIIEQHTRLSPLLVAIPFFMLLMIIELVILKTCRIRSAAAQYTISGIINSVCAGVVQQIGGMAMKRVGLHLLSYGWFHQRYCVAYFFPMTGKYLGPPLSVLAVDLCYYFAHRLGHQLGFIWAGHHVHHNSDEYNLSTALKQSWLSQVFTSSGFILAAYDDSQARGACSGIHCCRPACNIRLPWNAVVCSAGAVSYHTLKSPRTP